MRGFFSKIQYGIVALSLVLTHHTAAQDGAELRDLQVNPRLINTPPTPVRKSANPLLLPFFDDFSSLRSPYPNPALWQDNKVFINTNFPLFPPTIGVATFDALDANGYLYAEASSGLFSADTLTSQPIRLDSVFSPVSRGLTVGDSIYLSFYFQPGGGLGDVMSGTQRGRAPVSNEEFLLEFRSSADSAAGWDLIWSVNGQTLEEFCPLCARDTADQLKTYFRQVMIPIVDEKYLYNGFQFRFRNRSVIDPTWQVGAGQWHLDYVYLAHNRSANDVFSEDIAFVDRAARVLKDFQAMPAKQFRAETDLVDRIPLIFRNLGQMPRTTEYQYRIFNQTTGEVVDSTDISDISRPNVYPFHTHGFNAQDVDGNSEEMLNPRLTYTFPNVTNPSTFTIQHIWERQGSEDFCATNDTMEHTVRFENYYAYDDGTPEVGFGFGGDNASHSEFAYRFPLRVSDTLVAIKIWFSHPPLSDNDMSRAFFNFAVWAVDNDLPGQEIFVGERLVPVYDDTIGFHTYILERPVILPEGPFFIGFQQQSNAFLNIGFDQNNNAENSMFQWLLPHNEWLPVLLYGSVMMRPVFGTLTPTGICERGVVADKITVYPNPSDGVLFVESSENVVNTYEIYDLSGRRLMQRAIEDTHFSITLPEPTGTYILVLHTAKGLVSKKVVRR